MPVAVHSWVLWQVQPAVWPHFRHGGSGDL